MPSLNYSLLSFERMCAVCFRITCEMESRGSRQIFGFRSTAIKSQSLQPNFLCNSLKKIEYSKKKPRTKLLEIIFNKTHLRNKTGCYRVLNHTILPTSHARCAWFGLQQAIKMLKNSPINLAKKKQTHTRADSSN